LVSEIQIRQMAKSKWRNLWESEWSKKYVHGLLPISLERTLKNFWQPFLVKRNGGKSNCLSPKGEFWVCSEANVRMVKNYFR